MLESKDQTRPSVGIALGGGGIRGVTHIGILEAFCQQGVPIDIMVGSSVGGLITGLYGTGFTPEDLKRLAMEFKEGKYFDFEVNFSRAFKILVKMLATKLDMVPEDNLKGLISGWEIEHFLLEQTAGKYFNQTNIPIAITATDLKTGELIIFTDNEFSSSLQKMKDNIFITDKRIFRAIRATISIPGFFVPPRIGGRLLVDGGVKDNVPVDILAELEADIIVAVDLGFAIQDDSLIRNPLDMVLQSIDVMGQEVANLKLDDYADVIIRPQLGEASLTDIEKIPYFLQLGKKIGNKFAPEVQKLLEGE